jgi:hypothetical protein
MLYYVQEFESKNTIAINPKYVVAVFVTKREDGEECVNISLINGNVSVVGNILEIVGDLNGSI